jgi:ABC-type sulfate transport system substrate-binding protein
MKLLSIAESDDQKHKYVAVFDNDGRKKTVRFGSKGMDDYTLTHDKEQRDRYRKRHTKDLKGDPSRAGYLSYYVLWGDSTNIKTNIRKYVKMFDL